MISQTKSSLVEKFILSIIIKTLQIYALSYHIFSNPRNFGRTVLIDTRNMPCYNFFKACRHKKTAFARTDKKKG